MSLLHGSAYRLLPYAGRASRRTGEHGPNIDNHSDPKLRDTLAFARKSDATRRASRRRITRLFTHTAIANRKSWKSSGMSALAVYANIMADATAMENDEMFDRL